MFGNALNVGYIELNSRITARADFSLNGWPVRAVELALTGGLQAGQLLIVSLNRMSRLGRRIYRGPSHVHLVV